MGGEPRQQEAGWLEESRTSQEEPIIWTLQKLMPAIETELGISLQR